ncbi:MAG: hypothetical protein ACREEP_11025, partial [Dongiaceae bacterium]
MPTTFDSPSDRGAPPATPVAHATPTPERPIDDEQLGTLTTQFVGKTIGQRYFGPGWVKDDGIASVVFIAHDDRVPARIRTEGRCGIIAWRWNNSPSAPLSLTIMLKGGNDRPHVRWMRSSEDPVVSAIRREGRFYMIVVNADGQRSGWHEAVFIDAKDKDGTSRKTLERQWTFPTPGIPYSNVHDRFDPLRREAFNKDHEDEIPLWSDPPSDQWSALHSKGPWTEDLQPRDNAMAAWGRQAVHTRGTAAGFVQVILERQQMDGQPPVVDAAGIWLNPGPLQERATAVVDDVPLIGRWLAGMAGPEPNAKSAYDAAFDTLHDPHALHTVVSKLFEIVLDSDDEA